MFYKYKYCTGCSDLASWQAYILKGVVADLYPCLSTMTRQCTWEATRFSFTYHWSTVPATTFINSLLIIQLLFNIIRVTSFTDLSYYDITFLALISALLTYGQALRRAVHCKRLFMSSTWYCFLFIKVLSIKRLVPAVEQHNLCWVRDATFHA